MRYFSRKLKRFGAERSGVAAVEFAFILPILVLLYMGTIEISEGVEVDKKLSRATATVADLVGQQTVSLTQQQLVNIARVGAAITQPYFRDVPLFEITGVNIAAPQPGQEPVATVAWSIRVEHTPDSFRDPNAAPYPVERVHPAGQVLTDIPEALMTDGAFYIRVQSTLRYAPFFTYFLMNDETETLGHNQSIPYAIGMGDTYYLQPRLVAQVGCTDCP